MKRWKRGLSALLLSACVLCGCGKTEGRTVTVQSVSEICGMGPIGVAGRFGGIVVSGEKEEVKKDATKKVLEVLVEVGQDVKAGDVLFTYDTKAMEFSLSKLYLDLETARNTITYSNRQLDVLHQRLEWASENDRASYELQIATLEADVKEAEYNISLKERDIATMEKSMSVTEVTAGIDGRITRAGQPDSASSSGSSTPAGTDSSSAPAAGSNDKNETGFVTITDMTNFRIEGQINELNVGALSVGMPVIIRSRVDNDRTWTGTLKSIDWEHPVSSSNTDMFGGSDSGNTATKYPFYVTLNSIDDLILGQHVYIEPDFGQNNTDGLVLPAYYLVNIHDSQASVWAEGSGGKLEQRSVTLGDYDGEQETYVVLSGLKATDYIAFPEDGLNNGLSTSRYTPADAFADFSMEDADFSFGSEDLGPADAAGEALTPAAETEAQS